MDWWAHTCTGTTLHNPFLFHNSPQLPTLGCNRLFLLLMKIGGCHSSRSLPKMLAIKKSTQLLKKGSFLLNILTIVLNLTCLFLTRMSPQCADRSILLIMGHLLSSTLLLMDFVTLVLCPLESNMKENGKCTNSLPRWLCQK